jgi:hypothetical protein
MTIRITTITEPGGTVLKVDGRLASADQEELVRTLRERDGPVTLDLTDLMAADRSGAALLRELLAMGVELRSASPYVKLLLASHPEAPRKMEQEGR